MIIINKQSESLYDYQKDGTIHSIQFCDTQNLPLPTSNYFLYYYFHENQPLQYLQTFPQSNNFSQFQPREADYSHPSHETSPSVIVPKNIPSEPLFNQQASSMSQKIKQTDKKSGARKRELNILNESKFKDLKLDFRIQWKNQNRNIVPNLTNQMISFVLKKTKSQKLINKLFKSLKHDEAWNEKKFYLYMKKIKESVTHYVNQNAILKFLEIHEPKCQLYKYEEQLFYMRICRILIMKFLQNDAILISLTSNRMSSAKRMIHLIARDALKRKFLQLCKQHMF